jgi:hypothetical protein
MQGNAGLIGSRWVRALLVLGALLTVSLASATTALAAPPANDARANAQQIALGDNVSGTTTEATADEDDAFGCGPSDTPSVWYRIDGTTDGRAIVQIQAQGDLDVVFEVYRRERSQFSFLSCDTSDRNGRGSTEFRMRKGQSYLIRVAQQAQSVSGDFTLSVNIGQPEASAPGPPLPRGGASGDVQRIFEPSNSYSAKLKEGKTYRINLSPESCMRLSIYGPNADSFDGQAKKVLGCGGYTQFTPGPHESGRYSFLIEPASSRRSPQSYHLQLGSAKLDDTVPGRFVRNFTRDRGSLNANRLDVVDLYRFDVVRQSITDLVMSTSSDFDLVLVRAGGKRVARGTSDGGIVNIHARTGKGRYFVIVRAHRHASGRYRLSRASKTITRTSLTISPRSGGPGSSVSLRVHVAPGASGPVTILVERFDPTTGWVFNKRFETRASGGSAGVTFRPPSVGRYRARAVFNGTKVAAGSKTGFQRFRIEAPLSD